MSDSEYEEEEYLVYADFKNQLTSNEIADTKSAIKVIGIDSKNPIIEINGNVFKGEYEYSLGTLLFFDKDKNDEVVDPLYEPTPKQKYKFFVKTDKVLNFQRLYVEAKEDEPKDEPTKETVADKNTEKECSLEVNVSYEDIIKQLPVQRNV